LAVGETISMTFQTQSLSYPKSYTPNYFGCTILTNTGGLFTQ